MDDKQYSQYYVAFLDVLGFKNKVNSPQLSCQNILEMYNRIGDIPKEFYKGQAEDIIGNVKMKIMSDSICLYIEADIPNALFYLTLLCVAFQFDLLVIPYCTFVRGGITFGEMYVNGDILFGPALTEAYLLEEKNAKVPRIIIRKGTLDHGMSKMDKKLQDTLNFWIFQDDDAFYTADYFKLLVIEENRDSMEEVKKWISQWLDTTIDDSIRQKYLYVKKQIRKRLEEKTDA